MTNKTKGNIVINHITKQMGFICFNVKDNKWWRVYQCGCWKYSECIRLTIPQIRYVLNNETLSWNYLSEEDIELILKH